MVVPLGMLWPQNIMPLGAFLSTPGAGGYNRSASSKTWQRDGVWCITIIQYMQACTQLHSIRAHLIHVGQLVQVLSLNRIFVTHKLLYFLHHPKEQSSFELKPQGDTCTCTCLWSISGLWMSTIVTNESRLAVVSWPVPRKTQTVLEWQ